MTSSTSYDFSKLNLKRELAVVGTIGALWWILSNYAISPADAKSLRSDIEALHTAPLLFNLVLQLKPHRHFAPTAYDDLITWLDRYIMIKRGVVNMKKADPGYALSEDTRQKAFAIRDQAVLTLSEFMNAVYQHADPIPTVRIERICVAIREHIEMVWREHIANGRLLFG